MAERPRAGCDPAVPPDTELGAIRVVRDAYAAAADADAIVVLTEWAQFRMLDWMKVAMVMRTPVVVDTRSLLDPGCFAGRDSSAPASAAALTPRHRCRTTHDWAAGGPVAQGCGHC